MTTGETYGYSLEKPPFDPIVIAKSSDGHYTVRRGGKESEFLCWCEMIDQIICLTFDRGRPGYAMESPEFREAREEYQRAKIAFEVIAKQET